jgi:hypothetical protein
MAVVNEGRASPAGAAWAAPARPFARLVIRFRTRLDKGAPAAPIVRLRTPKWDDRGLIRE